MAHFIIAENGESVYHITAHQYADETVRYAASELQKYLLKSTNAAIPYHSDRCPQRGPEIRIGQNVRGTAYIPAGAEEESYRIFSRGEDIYIVGNTARGVLYGVYGFLERFCGFRCFTKDVEVIDRHPVLKIELDDICVEPAFEFRDTYFRFAFDGDFCAKNHSNTSLGDLSKAKGGRTKWFNFHHSFFDLVSPDLYFAEHPEYFSQVNGIRISDGQLCLTNPQVAQIAEKTLRRWIRENPECTVFSIAQNDNYKRCACERCRTLEEKEGSPAGPIIHFVNTLADRIKDEFPRALLHTFAYQYSLPAPKYAIARDNVIVRLCSISCRFDKPFQVLAAEGSPAEAEFVDALHNWAKHASRLYVWDYAVNFYHYPQPFLHLRVLQENIKLFKKTSIRGVLQQGNFAYGGGVSLDELKAYIISRLLWDPDSDIMQDVHHFCCAVYGEAAGAKMEEYIALTNTLCESAPLEIFQHPDAQYITDDYIAQADKIFTEAMALAENNTHRQRIEKEYLSIRFLKLARMPIDTPNRETLVDDFFNDLKRFGITEISERYPLAVSKKIMLNTPYMKDRSGYKLYYIMQ